MMTFFRLTAAIATLCGLALFLSDAIRAQDKSKEEPKVITTKSGLKFIDEKVGTGKEAKAGDTVTVHYTGWFSDGKKFDSSRDRNEPFDVTIGKTRVIKGWHEGLTGMKEGGKRKLIIPPELAYGEKGREGIPPNSELTFEVEVLKIK